MQTKNLIQTTANVIKITNLKKGDVVKMIADGGYSSPEIFYAVVLDLLNDGENTFIEMLQYKKNYSSVKAEIKLFKGTDDISLFPTTTDEVKEYFESAIKQTEDDIEFKKEELQKKIDGLEKAKEFASGELSKKLSEVEYSEMQQEKYDAIKAEKQERLKELSESV